MPLLSVPLRSVPLHVRPRRSIATACACSDTVSGSVCSSRARELKTTRACESAARDLSALFSSSLCCVSLHRHRQQVLFPWPAAPRRDRLLHFSDIETSCGRTSDRIPGCSDDPRRKTGTRHASWPLTLNLMTFDISEHGRTVVGTIYASKRAAPPHTRSHVTALIGRSLQSLWFVDAREPQPVPSPSGQRHSVTVVNCRLVQQYIRSSDLEPDSKRLPCHVPRSTGCSSRMRDEYMYDMTNCSHARTVATLNGAGVAGAYHSCPLPL